MRRYDATRHARLAEAFGETLIRASLRACPSRDGVRSLRGLPDCRRAARRKGRLLLLAGILIASTEHRVCLQMGGVLLDDSWRPPRLRADRCAVRDALRRNSTFHTSRWSGRCLIGWAKAQGVTLAEGPSL